MLALMLSWPKALSFNPLIISSISSSLVGYRYLEALASLGMSGASVTGIFAASLDPVVTKYLL